MKRMFAAIVLLVSASSASYAQQTPRESVVDVKTTSAYTMLVLKKVAVEAELEGILSENTSDYLNAKIKQFELDALNGEIEKMAETAESNLPKLTSGYGTLILRKAKLESDIQALLLEFTADHPNVKVKRVELDSLEREIAKIMR